MNTKAAICREVLDEVSLDIDVLADRLSISEKMRDSIVLMLCGEGVLRRTGNHLTVNSEKRAREIAPSEPLAKTAPVPNSLPATHSATTKPLLIALPSEFKIEKDVPIPTSRLGRAPGKPRFPFADMAIGDSFAIPVPPGIEPKLVAAAVRKDASNWRRTRPEFQVAIRTEPTGESVRCWRIESNRKVPGNAARDSKGAKVGKSLAAALA